MMISVRTDEGRTAMTDTATKTPIRVSIDGTAGPYIMVPTNQLDQVRNLLESNRVRFWVDHNAISIDGRVAVAVVNLGRDTDTRQVQTLLDTVA
jgi:hypothetical protein